MEVCPMRQKDVCMDIVKNSQDQLQHLEDICTTLNIPPPTAFLLYEVIFSIEERLDVEQFNLMILLLNRYWEDYKQKVQSESNEGIFSFNEYLQRIDEDPFPDKWMEKMEGR